MTIVRRGGEQVEGSTTAASIFLTAGVAVAVAVEQFLLSGLVAVGAVVVLALIALMEARLEARTRGRDE